ncbi:DAZ-associated protein 2 [Eumeta japonica]|uniref:DAZ-associated protein 2 n=1 Tax=Eumeta variegata TaxID=151549 RepID=A0A4C1YVB0_EUMVA|nr:DAZ-associated protein 2 [Eumeta japonica]
MLSQIHRHTLCACPVAGGSPYGVAFGGAGGAGGVYPPPYEQLAQHHQSLPALSQQVPMYSPAAAAAMYAAAASYPGYIGYPVQYYPYYPAVQPSIQPLRPTIMIPNGFEAGARFDGISQPLLPPAPPGVPPTPAQLAAMAGHQVALGQKRSNFLTGGADGGYTFCVVKERIVEQSVKTHSKRRHANSRYNSA